MFDTELQIPLSNGLVADHDPALCWKVFNISEAQAESVVEPDSMADDFWRKSVSVIAGRNALEGVKKSGTVPKRHASGPHF